MDIYDYAMQIEKNGEELYRGMASNTRNIGIRNILTMLADAEVNHYNTFKRMKEGEKIEVPDSSMLKGVKNIFQVMKESGDISNLNISQIDLYKKAEGIEKRSEEFYLKGADEATDNSLKEALRKIASEENQHFRILENIISLLERPQQWLEDAEWYQPED